MALVEQMTSAEVAELYRFARIALRGEVIFPDPLQKVVDRMRDLKEPERKQFIVETYEREVGPRALDIEKRFLRPHPEISFSYSGKPAATISMRNAPKNLATEFGSGAGAFAVCKQCEQPRRHARFIRPTMKRVSLRHDPAAAKYSSVCDSCAGAKQPCG